MSKSVKSMLSFGPVSLHLYGLIITIGALGGFLVAKKRAKLFKISSGEVENIYLLFIPSSFLGARAYHVLHQWEYYSNDPRQVLMLWQGGLGIYGAIVAGLISLFVYTKIKKLSFLKITDFLFPSVALSQAIGRLANFFNQEAFGPPTNLPWKIYISPENRPYFWQQHDFFHPLFLYESLFMFFGFALLLSLGSKGEDKKGLVTGTYLILYGIIRFLTEFGRFDTWQISTLKVAHVFSIILIIAGAIIASKKV